jgi:type II secretory pathway pseudopilin PulG
MQLLHDRTRARAPLRARVPHASARRRERGISLIIAMLMLAVIGLASAAIMRNATSGDQVATNIRLQTQASQYAQLALRYCARQLALAPAARRASVAAAFADTPPAWTARANWTTGGLDMAHTLTAADIGSSVPPRVPPQCLVEATIVDKVYTVTARGFSPDFRADAGNGATRSGSVVWLQATLYAEDGAGEGGGLSVQRRLWQQLLTPPF